MPGHHGGQPLGRLYRTFLSPGWGTISELPLHRAWHPTLNPSSSSFSFSLLSPPPPLLLSPSFFSSSFPFSPKQARLEPFLLVLSLPKALCGSSVLSRVPGMRGMWGGAEGRSLFPPLVPLGQAWWERALPFFPFNRLRMRISPVWCLLGTTKATWPYRGPREAEQEAEGRGKSEWA